MQNDINTMIRIDDIDWTKVETTVRTERLNAKMLRERFAIGITPATFKKWMNQSLSSAWSIDWGKQGKNNYIRLLPKGRQDILISQLKRLVTDHGLEAILRAMAEATKP